MIQDPFAVYLPDGVTPNPGYIDPIDFMALYPAWSAIVFAESRADVVLARTIKVAAERCAVYNDNLKQIYLAAFTNWLAGWNQGSTIASAPQPPKSFIVIQVPTGPSPDAPKLAVPDQSGPPVMAQPAIPPVPVPVVPAPPELVLSAPGVVGARTGGNEPDGFAEGDTVTRADGSVWKKSIDYSPFGPQIYWECVKGAN